MKIQKSIMVYSHGRYVACRIPGPSGKSLRRCPGVQYVCQPDVRYCLCVRSQNCGDRFAVVLTVGDLRFLMPSTVLAISFRAPAPYTAVRQCNEYILHQPANANPRRACFCQSTPGPGKQAAIPERAACKSSHTIILGH